MIVRCLMLMASLGLASPVSAGSVVLTTLDGSLSMEGELLSYDGEFLRIRTAFGAVTLDSSEVTCAGVDCPDPSGLVATARIAGTNAAVHRLMPGLMEAFADRQGLRLSSRNSDDTGLIWDLTETTSDRLFAVFEAAVDHDPLARLAAREVDVSLGPQAGQGAVRQDVIALDAFVPVVAPDNARAMVSATQLSELLTGRLASWADLGGPDVPVVLHLPQDADGLPPLLNPEAPYASAQLHLDGPALSSVVAADPQALGIASFSMMGNAVPLVIGGACGLAVPATTATIKAEDYPLTQPLFLQRLGARQPKVLRDFIAFARSEDAQRVVRAAGFVDQSIGRIGFDRQGDRVANAVLSAGEEPAAMAAVRDMVGILISMDRLTLTFRFLEGSSELDPQSASSVRRLGEAIAAGAFDGEAIVFAGFSDGTRAQDDNLRLSQRRAEVVRSAVEATLNGEAARLETIAFGEAMPMACNDTAWRRRVNARVEVWVRQR